MVAKQSLFLRGSITVQCSTDLHQISAEFGAFWPFLQAPLSWFAKFWYVAYAMSSSYSSACMTFFIYFPASSQCTSTYLDLSMWAGNQSNLYLFISRIAATCMSIDCFRFRHCFLRTHLVHWQQILHHFSGEDCTAEMNVHWHWSKVAVQVFRASW